MDINNMNWSEMSSRERDALVATEGMGHETGKVGDKLKINSHGEQECAENCQCGGCEYQREILRSNQFYRQMEDLRKEEEGS